MGAETLCQILQPRSLTIQKKEELVPWWNWWNWWNWWKESTCPNSTGQQWYNCGAKTLKSLYVPLLEPRTMPSFAMHPVLSEVAYGLPVKAAPSLKDNETKHVEADDYHKLLI